ncbi:leucine-rich repeat domain-containing protein, partial [Leptothoe sp. PORK10 BA2]|uniref:leucine-rich repeat domain-containing protein n=1 Tax=Leptothoe sp. PORK10 BA2 TaxID=3110254 RepID=UPI002B1EECA5
NQLTSVPKELGQLNNLTSLSLYQNQLTSVPKELGQLNNLTSLYLYQNQLTSVPKELGQLNNLTSLYLDHNQLTSVPKELGHLNNLTSLSLSHNQLTSVPKELGQLNNLTSLSLYQNQLTSVPKELGQLNNLTSLYLYQNQLTSVPKELGQLNNLTSLYLDQNQLTAVPKELGQLNNLTSLYLDQNQLTAVPKELGQLNNLTDLDLDQNQLTSVPDFILKLTNLERIDLNDNNLKTLPNFLEQLPKLKALLLHNNPSLNISDEILGPTYQAVNDGATPAKPADILNYYFRIQTDHQPLNEAKLILVGFGAVGKTSLANRLIHGTFDPDSKKTEGINITQWPLKLHQTEDITLHVWDFGGQEIMHSTHQFFLTERSLYLLVLNGRQGHEDNDAEYWLELIQSFGGDSPIIVVLNKVAEHPFDVNRRALQQKFPNIREFIQTDCEAEIATDTLRAAIERETDRLEHLRDPFPGSWFEIKKRLSTMANNYISFEKYREICQADGETESGAQNSLAVHLHHLGIALNYKDDGRLRDTHVLNPRWVTNGIYTLLNDHGLTATNGELEIDCLNRLLDPKDYGRNRSRALTQANRGQSTAPSRFRCG